MTKQAWRRHGDILVGLVDSQSEQQGGNNVATRQFGGPRDPLSSCHADLCVAYLWLGQASRHRVPRQTAGTPKRSLASPQRRIIPGRAAGAALPCDGCRRWAASLPGEACELLLTG